MLAEQESQSKGHWDIFAGYWAKLKLGTDGKIPVYDEMVEILPLKIRLTGRKPALFLPLARVSHKGSAALLLKSLRLRRRSRSFVKNAG